MARLAKRIPLVGWIVAVGLIALLGWHRQPEAEVSAQPKPDAYVQSIQPMLKKYCLDCHSTKEKKGELDLERFATLTDIRKDLKPWQQMIEQLETGEMPPKGRPQPTADEKKQLIQWTREFLQTEAKSRRGDPGHVPMRRLSNAEYDATIRDLTGVDLRPTREFPADGAGGEGFTNAAESLTDISPALLTKYFQVSRSIADHAVLTPDGIRFSPSKTRRDWSDEGVSKLREFYRQYTPADGKLNLTPYIAATVKHRDVLKSGKTTLDEIATKEKLNPKYLGILWQTLTDKAVSYPLDDIRNRWATATEKDVDALVKEIVAWQVKLWESARIGSYVHKIGNNYFESPSRQRPVDPSAVESLTLRLKPKASPGDNAVSFTLTTNDLLKSGNPLIWQRPRLEATGKPTLLLSEYAKYGPAYESDFATIFAQTSKYLSASIEATSGKSVEELARTHQLDAELLRRWIALLALPSPKNNTQPDPLGKPVPQVALELLPEKITKAANNPAINGWKSKAGDLPALMTNASDKVELIPGRAGAHGVVVHPMPKEFVAVAWKSPIAGKVRVEAKVSHAHPACGNGVACWLEQRTGKSAWQFAERSIDLGKEATIPVSTREIAVGDQLILAVDAKDGSHVCDLTEISLTITEVEKPNRVWNLAKDIADTIHAGNPHADGHGNKDSWSFVKGPTRAIGTTDIKQIPPTSAVGRWRASVIDGKPSVTDAEAVQKLLTGTRPTDLKSSDRALYDSLVSFNGPLLQSIDLSRFAKSVKPVEYGLPVKQFGNDKNANDLIVTNSARLEFRLPAALVDGREFVVDCLPGNSAGEHVVQFQVSATELSQTGIIASKDGKGLKRLTQGYNEFRQTFPLYLCFPNVIPTDEVVSLKMFHREDEPLERLFLSPEQQAKLNALWRDHQFVSKQAILENEHLPQFIGFVTQDQPKAMETFFRGQMPAFQKRTDAALAEEAKAEPKHLEALLAFADRAYRRPLKTSERDDLKKLYTSIRQKNSSHDEAVRGVIGKILLSPAFLFRPEEAPAGKDPKPVNDHELATRLSYFLWSSMPDDELRRLADDGKLHQPEVMEQQVKRMLKNPHLRNLAIEFGTQWIHVRGFDELKEKNEKLFPMFNAELRRDLYEESIQLFQHLFEADRPVLDLLNADYTFVNDRTAKHYGIPGVTGPQFRRVEAVRKYGRGGVLGLASVQTKESAASRTSPILRGNWVVETLLGEKLPRPPANVPKIPDDETGTDKLTIKQQVERHTKEASCASCHVRIDPFGFAFEKFDAIGRLRDRDAGGLPIDTKAKLKDGTEFEGLDGLRDYLIAKKKDVIARLFCKRLLGYALGRSVTLADTTTLDDMVAALSKNDGRISAAVLAIVASPQFRLIRGKEASDE